MCVGDGGGSLDRQQQGSQVHGISIVCLLLAYVLLDSAVCVEGWWL